MRLILLSLFIASTIIEAPSARRSLMLRKRLQSDSDDNLDDEEEDDWQDSRCRQGTNAQFLNFLRKIKYDENQIPESENEGPILINISVAINNIRSVSEATMDYSLELFLREEWQDRRLINAEIKNKTEVSLDEIYVDYLWVPDTFVPNAVSSANPRKQSTTHRILLRLRSDGSILYSRRASLVVSCVMDLTLFPFDSQLCKMDIMSSGYTADQIQYVWSKDRMHALILHEIDLPDYQIKESYVTSRIESYDIGNFSVVCVCFVFSRSPAFSFLQLIIPAIVSVAASWVSLWMDYETTFQDMLSILLAITFLLFSYNEVMPRVSYLKLMDVFLGVCFCMVFCSLIKATIINCMRKRTQVSRKTSTAELVPIAHISSCKAHLQNDGNITEHNEMEANPLPKTAGICNYVAKVLSVISINGKVKRLQLDSRFIQGFHWIYQTSFLVGFILFCIFDFIFYPRIYHQKTDEDCKRTSAEQFAEIHRPL